MAGLRYNENKLQWTLLDFSSLEELIKVLQFGASKYEIDNWKKGLPFTQICDSLLRHLIAFLNKEELDSESQLPHTAHILANAMFLA